MYKIEIVWDFRSPTLGVLTGEVKIGNIDMGRLGPEDCESFSVKKERNTRGYKGGPPLFARCKPLVDIMVDAYYAGMIMEPESFSWFRNCFRHNNEVTIIMPD